MSLRKEKAAGLTTTSTTKEQTGLYHTNGTKSSIINELLAGLMVNLQAPTIASLERRSTLEVLDELIRLKVDMGLLKGVCFAN